MKKIISIVIAAACVLALFAGCSAKAPDDAIKCEYCSGEA